MEYEGRKGGKEGERKERGVHTESRVSVTADAGEERAHADDEADKDRAESRAKDFALPRVETNPEGEKDHGEVGCHFDCECAAEGDHRRINVAAGDDKL